jgi:hypothetical protein
MLLQQWKRVKDLFQKKSEGFTRSEVLTIVMSSMENDQNRYCLFPEILFPAVIIIVFLPGEFAAFERLFLFI